MNKVFCSIDERFVNPLFEVFDGGDFILSSYRDIEEVKTQVQIYFVEDELIDEANRRLGEAMSVVGVVAPIEHTIIPDEDWKLSYRRHFKVENIGKRLVTVPAWEKIPEGDRIAIVLDPGLAFGTGKHETTKACLEFIDELSLTQTGSFLDMGSGSGILSIAACKLGFESVIGFDVDGEAVEASTENAEKNRVKPTFFKYGLGAKVKKPLPKSDLVVANILGPLLIRFADEIITAVKDKLIISGILTELYPEVLAAYTARGFKEVGNKTIGEWTTGLLTKVS